MTRNDAAIHRRQDVARLTNSTPSLPVATDVTANHRGKTGQVRPRSEVVRHSPVAEMHTYPRAQTSSNANRLQSWPVSKHSANGIRLPYFLRRSSASSDPDIRPVHPRVWFVGYIVFLRSRASGRVKSIQDVVCILIK